MTRNTFRVHGRKTKPDEPLRAPNLPLVSVAMEELEPAEETQPALELVCEARARLMYVA